MYEPVLVEKELDLYNVYEVHKNYKILAMAVNVPLQVAEEICHILMNLKLNPYNLALYVINQLQLMNIYQTIYILLIVNVVA